MDDLEKVLDGISAEMLKQIKEMSKCKDVGERKSHAEIVNLLSQSLCSIIDTTSSAAAEMYDFMPDDFLD